MYISNNNLYFISNIVWEKTSNEEIINYNVKNLNEYIEVPKSFKDKNYLFGFINQKLYEATNIFPLSYDLEIIN